MTLKECTVHLAVPSSGLFRKTIIQKDRPRRTEMMPVVSVCCVKVALNGFYRVLLCSRSKDAGMQSAKTSKV